MAVLIERIAMILIALRLTSSVVPDDIRLECSDTDYATAESRATALRWNDEWQNHGFIQKIKYGVYKKIA